MFVRFRKQGRRLGVSLMQTRRIASKVRSEHVAALGSVDAEVSVRERFEFWAGLPERLARLGNRLGADEQPKIYAALHARIPMVTPDDQRAIQEEDANDDERFWDLMRDLGEASIQGHKEMIATFEAAIAEQTPLVADAIERVERSRDRLERLSRGEAVSGGLGKRRYLDSSLKEAGFTDSDLRRFRLMAELTPLELEALCDEMSIAGKFVTAARVRAARRIIRARASAP